MNVPTRPGSRANELPLAVFDIDGTLLRSARLDEECWLAAVEQTLGLKGISTDWGAYEHSTDRAILSEIVRTRLGRVMTEQDEMSMLERFVALLTERVRRKPADVAPTRGAGAALSTLPSHGWRVAIGTGGWRRSATLKLRWAGLDVSEIPAAFAEDGPERERIIGTAMRRAMQDAASRPSRLVYIGDGTWDAKAAARIGAAFVGIGEGDRADQLRRAGAAVVLKDFGDAGALLSALTESTVPTAALSGGAER